MILVFFAMSLDNSVIRSSDDDIAFVDSDPSTWVLREKFVLEMSKISGTKVMGFGV